MVLRENTNFHWKMQELFNLHGYKVSKCEVNVFFQEHTLGYEKEKEKVLFFSKFS